MSALPSESIQTLLAQAPVLVRVALAGDREPGPVLVSDGGCNIAADIVQQARERSWQVCELPSSSGAMYLANAEAVADRVALVLLIGGACDDMATLSQLRERFRHALFLGERESREVDLVLPQSAAAASLSHLLSHAANHWRRSERIVSLIRDVGESRRRMHQLTEIGNSLTSSAELDDLLETILAEARRIAGCEGASLYLLDDDEGQGNDRSLIFKLAQNEAVDMPFVETRLPLSAESIAGYVALFGRELNLEDAYAIDPDAPYHFNSSFDERQGYRTRSMLVLPMRDHRDRVVGVLQFINRCDPDSGELLSFNEESTEVLRAIASQAAVSIQKNLLIADMNSLFESFVQASVKTIEQRDPSTSGHSFRVADKTVALLTALPQSNCHRFTDLQFSASHLKEVRYAALLHDFGKIGVRENILVKAKKLSTERLAIIEHRIALAKERLRRKAVEQQLSLLHQGCAPEQALTTVYAELETEVARLDQFWEWVQRANEPNVMEAGDYAHLVELNQYQFKELDGQIGRLLSADDLTALSVRRGSLTPEERVQIEAHVAHTRDFLSMLRWPEELAGVPSIAGAHHEKLNGTGYPDGLVGDQIPLASRVMTVCDIYDALTAMDRPYKKSMAVEDALRILEKEASSELLDEDIVRVFIESGVYQRSASFG